MASRWTSLKDFCRLAESARPDDTSAGPCKEAATWFLRFDEATEHVVGFITAIPVGVLSEYIPLLEVLPDWQGRGTGQEQVRRMQERLSDLYLIDLLCDEELQPYDERPGFMRSRGMMARNYVNQSWKGVTKNS